MNRSRSLLLFIAGAFFILSCERKELGVSGPAGIFDYGDSILYMKSGSTDHIVLPQSGMGDYTSYPAGLEMDPLSGAINVTKSETGLRYVVSYTDAAGKISTAKIVLAGINYPDRFHNLQSGDSLSIPVYNADNRRRLPAGNSFDDGNLANSEGLAVMNDDGVINLSRTVRNGLFGASPKNGARLDVRIPYRINDKSSGALNSIQVRLYYYNTLNDVPQELIKLLADREKTYVRLMDPSSNGREYYAKPRPPCVIIVGQ